MALKDALGNLEHQKRYLLLSLFLSSLVTTPLGLVASGVLGV